MHVRIGIIISIVTQTPKRHFNFDLIIHFSLLASSGLMPKIQVFKIESFIMSKMQMLVVKGDRAFVTATFLFDQTYKRAPT